jgi:hypothetical protein
VSEREKISSYVICIFDGGKRPNEILSIFFSEKMKIKEKSTPPVIVARYLGDSLFPLSLAFKWNCN